MTSTRFVLRLMIGSIGDRTISRAFRADHSTAASAELRNRDKARRSWLKRACYSSASLFKALYKAADSAVRAFGPTVDESTNAAQAARSRIIPVCRSALLELTLLERIQSCRCQGGLESVAD